MKKTFLAKKYPCRKDFWLYNSIVIFLILGVFQLIEAKGEKTSFLALCGNFLCKLLSLDAYINHWRNLLTVFVAILLLGFIYVLVSIILAWSPAALISIFFPKTNPKCGRGQGNR